MENKIDNGGSIAIKGFNYQKASIILVMINNFERDDFFIVPEAYDDFQIHVEGKNIYIQVKGEKSITLRKLIDKQIIEKNLIPGNDDDIRKIFLWDIGKTFRNELIRMEDGNIISPLFKYSDDDFNEIIDGLNLDINKQQRLSNQFLYITPFNNDLTEAIKRLFGEMISKELYVDNRCGRALLAELALMIDQKSEIILNGDNYKDKVIDGEYLRNTFMKLEQFKLFDCILSELPYNVFKKDLIRQERTKILVGFQSTKKKIKEKCANLDFEYQKEIDLVEQIVKIIENEDTTMINENLRIAIALECLCELWGR